MRSIWQLKSILEKKLDSFWVASKHEAKQLRPHVRRLKKKKKTVSYIKPKTKSNSNINRIFFQKKKKKNPFSRQAKKSCFLLKRVRALPFERVIQI